MNTLQRTLGNVQLLEKTRELQVILLFESGSKLHGTSTPDSDHDYSGIFLESTRDALGLGGVESIVYGSSDNESKNTRDDYDVTLYSLRKWAKLAAKGNPTALEFLFVPDDDTIINKDEWWLSVKSSREIFLARSHLDRFVGYAEGQMERLRSQRTGILMHEDEDPAFIYDGKMASHVIRLMCEAIELMKYGCIDFPVSSREFLSEIRRNKIKLPVIESEFNWMVRQADYYRDISKLPEEVDKDAVSELLADIYINYWTMRETYGN